MHWYQDEEEEEDDLQFSPALLARRASESWIDTAPLEVYKQFTFSFINQCPTHVNINTYDINLFTCRTSQ